MALASCVGLGIIALALVRMSEKNWVDVVYVMVAPGGILFLIVSYTLWRVGRFNKEIKADDDAPPPGSGQPPQGETR